jgi:hypothetical protein
MEGNEFERRRLLKTLPAFNRGSVCRYMTVTLMNSYLKDLYLETKRVKP